MRTFFILLIFALPIFTISCGESEIDKESRVDSLSTKLTALEAQMQVVDIRKINDLIAENQKLIERVSNEVTDTLNKEEMFFLSDYKRYRKSLNQLKENANFQFEQFGYTRNQLENLSEDIENGLVVDDLFTEYYLSEKEAINRLEENATNIISWYNGTFERYNQLKEGVEKILEDRSN